MMHIALTIDSKFVRYCAVTIVSILENNDPKDIMLHIVSGHLPKEDVLTLSQVAEKYGTSIAFYYIPHEKLQNYEVKWQKQRLSNGCLLSMCVGFDITFYNLTSDLSR